MVTSDLAQHWDGLLTRTGASAPTSAATLLARWTQPHRRYHDLEHLRAVLRHVDDLAPHAADPDAVRLAAWYHDAIYTGAPDDETASAALARDELTRLGLSTTLVDEVARLVELTATHDPAPRDRNGAVLTDADLAILAADGPAYTRYTDAVRAEYAHIPEEAFRTGRAAVLARLLSTPALFRTTAGSARWEASARANLAAELHGLTR
ncbi:MAG: HD domain-containing protein [Sporichthyaceae bacterium]